MKTALEREEAAHNTTYARLVATADKLRAAEARVAELQQAIDAAVVALGKLYRSSSVSSMADIVLHRVLEALRAARSKP